MDHLRIRLEDGAPEGKGVGIPHEDKRRWGDFEGNGEGFSPRVREGGASGGKRLTG